MSAVELVEFDEQLAAVNDGVARVVQQAQAIEVSTPEQAQAATGFLAEIATEKRRGETARKFLVDPLNEHVKRINAHFKQSAAPLDEADQVVRGKVLAYQRQAAEAARVEQERLDTERRAAEAAAEREQRRLVAEAAERERVAREQAEARQAKLREAQNERAREIAAMSNEDLADLLAQRIDEDDPETQVIREELRGRAARRAAEEDAAEARRIAEEAQQRRIAVASAPARTAAVAPLAAANGAASVRKEWKATVVDENLLPREYWQIDTAKINKLVKAGLREIPGVRIEQVDGLSVRAAR